MFYRPLRFGTLNLGMDKVNRSGTFGNGKLKVEGMNDDGIRADF
jgi:hypothetical protein